MNDKLSRLELYVLLVDAAYSGAHDEEQRALLLLLFMTSDDGTHQVVYKATDSKPDSHHASTTDCGRGISLPFLVAIGYLISHPDDFLLPLCRQT